MESLLRDLRFALRKLTRERRLSGLVLLCIALGIGVNAAIFSLVDGFFLRPLPVRAPEQLVSVHSSHPGFRYASFSYPNYTDLRDAGTDVQDPVAYSYASFSLSVEERNERLFGALVSGNYFSALGVDAELGRMLTVADDVEIGGHPVVVLSHDLWRGQFGARSDVVGREVRLNGHVFTVVGVAPEGFQGVARMLAPQVWVPLAMQPQVTVTSSLTSRGHGWLQVVARLPDGVTLASAQAAVDRHAEAMERAHPDALEDWGITLTANPSDLPPNMQSFMVGASGLMLVVALCVLLVACANVAGLLLARAESRRREMGIRLAIGASRRRLIRQLLTESTLLALTGGVAGLLIGWWGARLLPSVFPDFGVPTAVDLQLDPRLLGFALLLSLLTGIVFGLVPALQSARTNPLFAVKGEDADRTGRRRRVPLRNILVVAQVALSMLLLVGAGLFLRSLQHAEDLDPGFRAEGLLLADLDPSLSGYDRDASLRFYDQLGDRVEALPGVERVALSDMVPLRLGGNQQWTVEIEGYQPAEGERMNLDYNTVSPGYFETMEIPLVAGRGFDDRDTPDSPGVIIVNQTMASRYWPGGDALGRRVQMGSKWLEVVGIARDIKYMSLAEDPMPYMYLPLGPFYSPNLQLHVRTAGDPLALTASLREAVRTLDPFLPVVNLRTLEEEVTQALFLPRLGAGLTGSFGLLALILAAIGLYGVLAQIVSRRTREIGIRLAIGATHKDVFRQLLRGGLKLTAVGLVIGLVAALASSQVLATFLLGLSATDPVTYVTVTLLLIFVAIVAVAVPARRAMRVQPVQALRYE